MNVIQFKSAGNKNIAFCCVDNVNSYTSAWTRELVKNISDYTISNITSKGYDLFQGYDENSLLTHVADLGYNHAVVFSTGTEFINGQDFFEEIKKIVTDDYFVAGHVLDRDDAYYELHHQCYMISLYHYKELGNPTVGKQAFGTKHEQTTPCRSEENYHDNYTPTWIRSGNSLKSYNHKCHGWHILSIAFHNNLKVLPWNSAVRKSKKHSYPENQTEFLKHFEWIMARQNHCASTFVHTENTDHKITAGHTYTQILTPASGTNYKNLINTSNATTVIFYDYNTSALNYWREQVSNSDTIKYKFVQLDLLGPLDLSTILDTSNDSTFVNLSNIFCYEGTAAFASLEFRLHKENQVINHIRQLVPNAHIHFSLRAANGFVETTAEPVNLCSLHCPTWHTNGEWQ